MGQGPFLSLIKSVGSTQKLKTVSEVRSCHYNFLSVQQGLGGGRCAVPSRHGQKGGGRHRAGGGFLLQRGDHRGRVGFRDAEALGQGRQRAGRGIAETAQGG